MSVVVIFIAALVLDRLLGEPKNWHPLVGFGKLAGTIEAWLNISSLPKISLMLLGLLAVLLLTLPLTVVTAFISKHYDSFFIVETLVLYLAIGSRSLIEHAQQVAHALLSGRYDEARIYTSYLVSRDTANMTEEDMSRATIESTLENGNDAVFAPLFWFLIGGAPAVIFYRLVNTLDAMWGYRTTRFLYFGRAAARLDDILNFIPARLTALTYACLGQFASAIQCWRTQASACKSPNGGPVMSAGAGALLLQLGGPTLYHGKLENCPLLGFGPRPEARDIFRAIRLVQNGIYLWAGLVLLAAGGYALA